MIRRPAGRAGISVRLRRSILQAVLVVAFVCASALSAFADPVKGRVTDPQDQPVGGAEILFIRAAAVVTTARTGSDGSFGPVDVPDGAYDVVVVASGLRAAPKSITTKNGSAVDLAIKLSLAAVSESVVVSVAQVDTPLSRATDAVTVITADELAAQQTETVAEAMRAVPGMTVVPTGGRGSLTSFLPRGGKSDYTLVLVDGIPQNSFGGSFDASSLPTAGIERIEVVRGPQSALYGGGAIGALIHVITRQGGPLRANGFVESGGYGTTHVNASASGSHRAWMWGASADGLTTDGDTREFASVGGRVQNADYDTITVASNVGWSEGANRIRVDVRGGRNERGNPGAYGSDPLHRFFGIDTNSRGRNTFGEFGASATFGAGLLRHHGQFTYGDLRGKFLGDFPSNDRTRRVTARYQLDFTPRAVGISAGAEAIGERAENTFVTGETFEQIPIRRQITGVFVEARPDLGDRLFVNAGVRVEHFNRKALEANPGLRPALDDGVVTSTNPKLSVAWFAHPPSSGSGLAAGWTKVRLSAGTGIKPPNTFDLAFTNNPNLKPERNRSFDVGVEQGLGGSAAVVDATYFASRYDDLIVTVGTSLSGASRYRTDNIANARARGFELGLAWRAPMGITGRLAWTWLDSEVLAVDGLTAAPAPYKVGDPLVRQPKQHGSVEFGWNGARGHAFVIVNGRSKTLDIEPNFGSPTFDNPRYVTTTIGGSFRVVRNVSIVGRVTNVFDRAYEDTLGFPALGRAALVGVRVTTGR